MEFLVRGALQYDEPGVFMAFEETAEELKQDVASLGFDLDDFTARKKIMIDHIHIDRSEIEETGEYDLEGLFVRLGYAIDSIGAKRVVLDTIEVLFGGFSNDSILRAELRRLFRWLKEKGVTAIVTEEKGEGSLTRFGLEEYVADCVIALDHRVDGQISTRRLRIVKYRGSLHGTNEYPFLVGKDGISVLPITSIGLTHQVSTKHISTGVKRLDEMMENKGYFRGSSVLVSGTAGTGKSSLAAAFVEAACKRGERCLHFAFEESPSQIIRNMRSIGIDLEPWIKKGLLQIQATRPCGQGLESHLVSMHSAIAQFKPRVVVIDPITNLTAAGTLEDVKALLARLIDFLKLKQITLLCTSLTFGGDNEQQSEVGISSLMDTWILLRNLEGNAEHTRALYLLKSRGMAHSNQIREFVLSNRGIDLVDVCVGPEVILTGSARLMQKDKESAAVAAHQREFEQRRYSLGCKEKALEARIAAMRAEFDAEAKVAEATVVQVDAHAAALREAREELGRNFGSNGHRRASHSAAGR
jgi:circadian clock protein KaiC